jgi:hypothetical protein
MMDDSLLTIAELVFFLDHRRAVSRLALLDYRGPITITITISVAIFVGFTDRYAAFHGTDPHADIVGKRGGGNSSDHRRGEYVFPHLLLLRSAGSKLQAAMIVPIAEITRISEPTAICERSVRAMSRCSFGASNEGSRNIRFLEPYVGSASARERRWALESTNLLGLQSPK